jgi:DNA uptake protein ComE-like DNA-binding protein
MAKGHWLDPLARSLLQAAGHLPAETPTHQRTTAVPEACQPVPAAVPEPTAADAAQERIERDLLELKLQQNPARRLENAQEVRHAAALGWRLDVNRATAADWHRLPGISAAHVDLLLRLQRGGVQLSGPEDLQRLLELPSDLVASWQPLLVFRWYGDGAPTAPRPLPLDLNRAGPIELRQGLPQFDEQRRQRLLRERQRSPFQDLADLQERLQLPAGVVEELIGRVRFGRGPAGPELPRSA